MFKKPFLIGTIFIIIQAISLFAAYNSSSCWNSQYDQITFRFLDSTLFIPGMMAELLFSIFGALCLLFISFIIFKGKDYYRLLGKNTTYRTSYLIIAFTISCGLIWYHFTLWGKSGPENLISKCNLSPLNYQNEALLPYRYYFPFSFITYIIYFETYLIILFYEMTRTCTHLKRRYERYKEKILLPTFVRELQTYQIFTLELQKTIGKFAWVLVLQTVLGSYILTIYSKALAEWAKGAAIIALIVPIVILMALIIVFYFHQELGVLATQHMVERDAPEGEIKKIEILRNPTSVVKGFTATNLFLSIFISLLPHIITFIKDSQNHK